MTAVHLLHAGKYEQLDPVGRMRYLLFIRTGIVLPTQWSFLNPSVELAACTLSVVSLQIVIFPRQLLAASSMYDTAIWYANCSLR